MLKQKYTVKIDVTKLNKSKFRTWEKKDGTKVTEASVDVIITDNPKIVTKSDGTPITTDKSRLENHGFVVETPSKEEREQKIETPILGNVVTWVSRAEEPKQDNLTSPDENGDVIDVDSIPFN